ncbi:MAG TPA: EF-hand domain-containing protein [Burkholderiales bacterium]|nr:EF-hand domain-containing protein [Burkholderiales bacterium]
MLKSIGIALLTAMTLAFFAQPALSAQEDIQKLWLSSGYAHPGKGMRTMKMMHMMDTNKDGKVSKEEFMHYYEMVWDKMDPEHLGEISVNKWIGQ